MTQSERIALAAYYRSQGLPYDEIARVLRVDVSTISRDIRQGEIRGWLKRSWVLATAAEVDVVVRQSIRDAAAEQAIAERWGAQRLGPGRGLTADGIVVVKAGDDGTDDGQYAPRTHQMMAVEAVRLVVDRLQRLHARRPKEPVTMGVAWGRSTGSVVRQLKAGTELPAFERLQLVTMQGGLGAATQGPQGAFFPDILCHEVATAFRSELPEMSLNLPAFVEPRVAEAVGESGLDAIWAFIRADASFIRASAAWTRLDVGLIGIGGLEAGAWATSSGHLPNAKLTAGLKREGAVGDIVCRHFRSTVEAPIEAEGKAATSLIHLSNRRAIGITLTQLRRRVSAGASVIAVAGGSAGAKAVAIQAAVENGFVTDIVTDDVTASRMLRNMEVGSRER